jgi:uncharacterized protein (TIGR02266 family)
MDDRTNDRARGDRRFPITQSLEVCCENWSDFAQLYASDVSQGGMFIETKHPLPILSELRLELNLPEGHRIPLKAVVVHVLDEQQAAREQRPAGVGVQFIELEPERKMQIRQLVEFAQRSVAADGMQSLASHMFESALSVAPSRLFTPAPGGESGEAPTIRKQRTPRISREITTRPEARAPSNKPTVPAAPVPSRPPDPAKLKLGMTHLAHKHFDAAIKTFGEVVQDSGGNLEAHQWVLLAKARLAVHEGDPVAACEHYQNVLNIDEANHEARKFVREHHSKKRLESLPFGRFFVKKT